MRNTLVSLLFLLPLASELSAQQTISFTQGLASGRAHRYGRDAMYADTLAYALYSSALAAPAAGAVWYSGGGAPKTWTPVQADSSGTFRHPAMNNGYLYLRYDARKAQAALLTISGHAMVYLNGEAHAGDPYRYGYLHIPVQLKKGRNDLYIRSGTTGRFGGVKVSLQTGGKAVRLSGADATLPYLVKGISSGDLWAGIVCLNSTNAIQSGLKVDATIGGLTATTGLPDVHALGTRKVPVQLPVPAQVNAGTDARCLLTLKRGNTVLDTLTVYIPQVEAHQHQSHTFVSAIDGSVQYYAVAPQQGGAQSRPALFLSVHGAEVEAIGQARAYRPKPEGPLVAPTNRRPRGFNWEDWGRLDAMEVLSIAEQQYKPDPQRIYLTGHSMGGHGTWFLGATYPGKWAAMAPCAGYPVLQGYGSADGLIPTEAATPLRRMLLRASNPSNVLEMAKNYKAAGIYIYHGDADPTVSVNYARQMRQVLSEFHPDFAYYEYPGGNHWFGDISVDWPPLFEYFRQKTIKPDRSWHEVDFSTANPAIAHSYRWVGILQQERSFEYSRVKLLADTAKKTVQGNTENIRVLEISCTPFNEGDHVAITLDGQSFTARYHRMGPKVKFQKLNGQWAMVDTATPATEKGTVRGGGLKEAFNHRMVYVYGTMGTPEENAWAWQKARYDAETWYYRGNGAVDVIADTDFDAQRYAGRGVILYGNQQTNAAYNGLMQGCQVVLQRGKVLVGAKVLEGNDLGAYLVWPRRDDLFSSVAVVGGTGIPGMRAADANQYFAGGSGFPDFMVFSAGIMTGEASALKAAGYYDHQWKLGDDWRVHQDPE
ncbi:MAG TPA: prolyl oligopeptidase family serine peptidase [Phnomibacter sp.]|nr:prolyl oligopeptidase family serine peptidase [Phnomibacter sp.]